MTSSTSEEARVNHISAMGEELGVLYSELWQQLANLHLKWNEYIELFGVSQDRVKLLNEAAPSFFYIIENTLWLDILLTIARLTDPCEMKKNGVIKRNLTVQRLPDLISDLETKGKVKSLIEIAKVKSSFCREWRNSYIAHRDLDLTLKTTNAKPLEEGSRLKVRQALSALDSILNLMSTYYMDTTTNFEVVTLSGGAHSLFYIINDGLEYERQRMQKLAKGIFDKDDINPRPL